MQWMTPAGRGFDSSFGYLGGSEDHFTHRTGGSLFGCPKGQAAVDLYRTNATAEAWCTARVGDAHCNGTFGAYLFNDEAVSIIESHDASTPLFLYIATQDAHGPDQVTSIYSDLFGDQFVPSFAVYNGMVAAADDLFGNVTRSLRARRMYDNTVIVMSSDNGGPASIYSSSTAANNWPLRGGKKTDFEGGIRVSAFVSGGFLPPSARGSVRDQYLHCADWYRTLCHLAGGTDCGDSVSAQLHDVPQVDGFDVWQYIIGANETSPRTEIMIARCEVPSQHNIPLSRASPDCSGAYIRGDFKIIIGMQYYGFWQGPIYPNATTNHSTFDIHVDCGLGCLFNIKTDPAETRDLAKINPGLLQDMRERFFHLNTTQYDAPKCPKGGNSCEAYVKQHDGFFGPHVGGPDT